MHVQIRLATVVKIVLPSFLRKHVSIIQMYIVLIYLYKKQR